jgi:hypothetical protein
MESEPNLKTKKNIDLKVVPFPLEQVGIYTEHVDFNH